MDTLLNWLWQGIVVAAAATCGLKLVRIRTAEWRYRFWWASTAVVLLLPAIAAVPWTMSPMPVTGGAARSGETAYLPEVYVSDIAPIVMIVAVAWASWIAVHVIRTALAFLALRRLRNRWIPFPAQREARLEHWMTLRRATDLPLVVSDDVRSAAVIGVRSPAIAVSPRLLGGLTDDQLDRVLVHEWAHVERGDHVFHALQLLIRVLAGCHPAVWWIDRQLEAERESACDEMTVRLTGSPRAYAACLARLVEISNSSSASLPVPAAISSSQVHNRIVRVLGMRDQGSERRLRMKVGAAAAGIFLIGLEAASSALVLPAAERAATLVHGLPEMKSQTPVLVRTNAGVVPAAARTGARRQRNPQPAASGPVSTATGGTMQGIPAAGHEDAPVAAAPGEQAPDPGIDNLPLAATLNPDTIPALPATDAPVLPLAAEPVSPWGTAKDAGVAAGRASQKAAVSTAGFFNKFGRKIAGAF